MGALLSGAFLIATGAAVWSLVRFTKSFGAFAESQRDLTKVLWQVNETNLALHQSNIRLLERIERAQQQLKKEVAA